VTGAAPIFHDVLLAAQSRLAGRMPAADEALVDRPTDLAPRAICALSGRDATESCPRIETEWIPSDRPAAPCHWHHRTHGRIAVTWPPAYRAWARQQGLLDPVEATASAAGRPPEPVRVTRSPQSGPLRIVNPPPGAIYLLDPTLRAAFQTLPLRAVAESAAARLVWAIDGAPVGVTDGDRALDWPLARGAHTIVVTDGRETDETAIVVR